MSLIQFLRLVFRNAWLIMVGALGMAAAVFVLTQKEERIFSSETLINTGVVSGYSLDQSSSGSIDRTYTFNEMDNMMSLLSARETKELALLRLLAKVMAAGKPTEGVISVGSFQESLAFFPDSLLGLPEEEVFLSLQVEYAQGPSNVFYELINSKDPYFSIHQLGSLRVERIGTSDMIKLRYENRDPRLCQLTLRVYTEVFMDSHQSLKNMDSGTAISFFEEQVRKSQESLAKAEAELLVFGTENQIINYYEQTRFIAHKKENLDEMFFTQRMDFEAAKASLAQLESKLEDKYKISVTSGEVLHLRNRLSTLSNQIALMELQGEQPADITELAVFETEASELTDSIREKTSTLFSLSHTSEGIPVEQVLDEWLQNMITYTQSEARLSAIKTRQLEFESIYNRFAPLGSTLKKIEREIGVREDEYLSNLHSLNMAKLHQYNLQVASNIKIVDPPFLPLKPAPSKRMRMVLLAFLVGGILPLGLGLARALFDPTLKTPRQLAEASGHSVIGALPYQHGRVAKGLKMEVLWPQLMGILTQHLDSWKVNVEGPLVLNITSTKPGAGKSTLCEGWSEYLRGKGLQVVVVQGQGLSVEGLAEQAGGAEVVFVETAALIGESCATDVLAKTHAQVVVVGAQGIWSEADRHAVSRLAALHEVPMHLVLNRCPAEGLEELVGEVPKKRNFFHRWIKNLITYS